MKNNKLIPMSNLVHSKYKVADSVAEFKKRNRDGVLLLQRAANVYYAGSQYRKNRERYKRYYFNNQWSDMVTVDGKTMTEEEYIMKQGNIPLQNNLMRRLGRNVVGVYRSQSKEPMCVARDRDEQQLGETMSTTLQYVWQINKMNNINARAMEEFLIGGMPIQKKTFGWNSEKKRYDCWTENVQPNRFFVDASMSDSRTWDCSIIGEIHDLTYNSLMSNFCKSPADYNKVADMYRSAHDMEDLQVSMRQFGIEDKSDLSFLVPDDSTKCRVIEIWTKETKPRIRCIDYLNGDNFKIEVEDYNEIISKENSKRKKDGLAQGMAEDEIPFIEYEWFIDEYWYYRYMTPFGDILQEGETPYEHGSHPYVFMPYPFIDGEIHPFVGDFVDQQRYVNRLIILYDFLLKSSAKGALLVPEEALGDHSPEEFAENWAKVGSVIVYNAKKGYKPEQLSTNVTNIGLNDLLSLQLKFFEDISGVQGALQGRQGYASTSGTLYAQQTQNATMSLLDLLDSFSGFVEDGAMKDVSNIQQFYTTKRFIKIAGKSGGVEYDPELLGGVDMDVSVVESQSTPAFRDWANQWLMQLFQANAIGVKQLLENGDFPFADSLLQSINAQEQAQAQQMQQNGQAVAGGQQMQAPQLQPEQVKQMQEQMNIDPAKINNLQNMLQGGGAITQNNGIAY